MSKEQYVTVDGAATSGIFETLELAKKDAKDDLENGWADNPKIEIYKLVHVGTMTKTCTQWVPAKGGK